VAALLTWHRTYPFHAVWLGSGLYLTIVPAARRDLLGARTSALLIGQEVEDPVNEYGNSDGLLTLPHSHLVVTYTTKVVNPSGNRLATPDIVIVPTVSQVLAGTDPVLGRALSY
jgi:hypothetical protein